MSDQPTREYVESRYAELGDAVDARSGEMAVAVIERVRADGYPDLAERILKGLIEQGQKNMVAKAEATR